MRQLAIDLNCDYRDFYKAQNTILVYKKLEGNRFLVNLITEEIKNRNIIPYYGTWYSNIA